MKLERTRNASRNIVFGTLLKCYQLLVPFLLRTAIIYYLGMDYLGLNSLFSSILQVLNLAELGVSSAMVFAMYKPIADDDYKTICALLRLYKIYYRIIGFVILALGLLILPFIPKLILGSVPDNVNVYILYCMHLGATVLSYWLFAYQNSLLIAYQRSDITSKISIFTSTLQYFLQFIVLIIWRSYYLYLFVMLFIQIVTNIVTALVVSNRYPQFSAKGNLDKKETKIINQKIRDLFTAKLGAVVLTSVDSIVISAFLGLTMLAVYNNYYYIMTSIIGFVTILFNSCTAGLGNSFVTESKEKNYRDFEKLTFMISWLCGVFTCCFMGLYQPFMKIWVGEEYMLTIWAVVFLCAYYFICEINQLLNTFKDAAGIWHEDRFRPLTTAFTNLILNLVLVQIIGIYGIILSTAISILVIGMPWIIHNLFVYVFPGFSISSYIKALIKYTGVTLVATFMTYEITILLPDGMMAFGLKIVICLIIPNIMFFVVYHNKNEFREMLILIAKITNNKIKLYK